MNAATLTEARRPAPPEPDAALGIPITRPLFDADEESAIVAPLRSGWVVQGPKVAEFERLVAEHTGARHAVAVTSCTTGLHLALVAAGIGPGDEVILPWFTWVATANVVEYVGATPVFCDIDLATFTVDPADVAARITARTRAILPVQLFGLCSDMPALAGLAGPRGLHVIEDAACALDAWYDERHAGTFGLAGCFSFHPRKIITTGEGGMLVTNDDRTAAVCRSLRDHGAAVSDLERHVGSKGYLLTAFNLLGYNYRMTDFQGSLGVAQMRKLPDIQRRRRWLAARYDERLTGLPWLRTPVVPLGHRPGYQAYVCLYAPEPPTLENLPRLHERRNALMAALQARGIATRQGTHAVHTLGYYRDKYGLRGQDLPGALIADRLSLAIPLYPQMTTDDVDRVVSALRDAQEGLG